MGDESPILDVGKSSVQFEHGVFNNVLYVASLAKKLLYVYQMTHTVSPKRVVFEIGFNNPSFSIYSLFDHLS